jgi:hypothetical protein
VKLRPTRPRLLAGLAVLAAAVGWGIAQLVDTFADRSISVPITMPVVMGLLALALVLWARGTRNRLSARPGTRPIDPIVAARSAALAMAASRTGALVAGFYVGVAFALAPGWEAGSVRGRVVTAVVTVAAAVLVVLAALMLERICRLPDDPGDDYGDDSV